MSEINKELLFKSKVTLFVKSPKSNVKETLVLSNVGNLQFQGLLVPKSVLNFVITKNYVRFESNLEAYLLIVTRNKHARAY